LYTGEWKKNRAHGKGTAIEHGTRKVVFAGKWEEGLAKDDSGNFIDYYTFEARKRDKFEKKYFAFYGLCLNSRFT
jgi:hypothetical protein